jgi:hypothetical protein
MVVAVRAMEILLVGTGQMETAAPCTDFGKENHSEVLLAVVDNY